MLKRPDSAPLHIKLLGGFAVVLALSAAQSGFAYWTAQGNNVSDGWVVHTENVLRLASEVQTELLEMEAVYRGFVFSGDEVRLEPYAEDFQIYTADLSSLVQLTADNPPQVARWRDLEQRQAAWQREVVEPGIALRRATDTQTLPSAEDVLASAQQGLALNHLSDMTRILDDAMAVEQDLLDQRLQANGGLNDRLMQTLVGGTLLVLGLWTLVAILFARSLTRAIRQVEAGAAGLRASERRYTEAEQIAHVGSWELDLDSQQFTWSAEHYRIVGVEPQAEDLPYLRALGYIHPEDRSAWQAVSAKAIAEHGSYSIEIRMLRPDGSVRWIHSRGAFVVDADGGARRMVGTAQDITERKQAEDQRETFQRSEKLRALGQMASGIAHDLNQSLMLVASYSDLACQALGQDPPNLADLADLMATTTQAALDGGETVKRLLLFTRAAPEQDSQRLDLSTITREAAQLTAPRWRDAAQVEGRPISLHIEAEGHPIIQGSPARLRELMTNLIFNAVDALPTGGVIRLRVIADDGRAIVEVVDSGLGMSAEIQARVFEPFYTTKGESGTGLGLAMVFGIVEQHGGHIEVHSALGEGATFRMTFPLLEDMPIEAEPSPTPLAQLEPLVLLRILAVDDEPMMTKAVVRMLKPSGHLVSVARSGEEALKKLAEQTFDVVLSDMGMGGGMNGWELADSVKRRWPNVRFLLATGWGAGIDPSEARTRGVEAVLSKPYHPTELVQALSRTDAAA